MNGFAEQYVIFLVFSVIIALAVVGLAGWAIWWSATKESRDAANEEREARIREWIRQSEREQLGHNPQQRA